MKIKKKATRPIKRKKYNLLNCNFGKNVIIRVPRFSWELLVTQNVNFSLSFSVVVVVDFLLFTVYQF